MIQKIFSTLLIIIGIIMTLGGFFGEMSLENHDKIGASIFIIIVFGIIPLYFGLKIRKKLKDNNLLNHENTFNVNTTDNHENNYIENKHKQNTNDLNHSEEYDELEILLLEMNDTILRFKDVSINIKYEDRSSNITSRSISIHYLAESDFGNGYYIKAFCALRKEERHFNLESIISASIGENEIDLIQYLVDIYKTGNEYTCQKIIEKYKNEIIILNYIAQLDGRYTKTEKNIIIDYIKSLKEEFDDSTIMQKLSEIKPTSYQFNSIVKKSKFDNRIIEYAEKIAKKDELKMGAIKKIIKSIEKNIKS